MVVQPPRSESPEGAVTRRPPSGGGGSPAGAAAAAAIGGGGGDGGRGRGSHQQWRLAGSWALEWSCSSGFDEFGEIRSSGAMFSGLFTKLLRFAPRAFRFCSGFEIYHFGLCLYLFEFDSSYLLHMASMLVEIFLKKIKGCLIVL